MRIIRIQPSSFVDQIIDGHEMTKLPYPLITDEAGMVAGQDFWKGDPYRVVGFQRDLAAHRIDLHWQEVIEDPQAAVGMYLVTSDDSGDWGVHETAIASMVVLGGAQSDEETSGGGREG